MPDRVDLVRALVADVRATLDDLQARGLREEFVDASLPAAEAPDPQTAVTRGRAEVPAPGSGWAKRASEARTRAAEGRAFGAHGLAAIREDLGDCRRCNLCTGRQNIVFGVGDPEADLVVIGEGPGFEEDRRGEPFVGPAGQMLDKMMRNVLGLQRDEVYILNVVKCRPPDNRNPLPPEVEACMPFLHRQVEAISPRAILLLGTVALKSLMQTPQGITRHRGRWMEYRGIPVMPTFHPAYLLRNPGGKRDTFGDLKELLQRYDALHGKRTLPSPSF